MLILSQYRHFQIISTHYLSALLPLYSQIPAIAATQSLHYRNKEQLEKQVVFFSPVSSLCSLQDTYPHMKSQKKGLANVYTSLITTYYLGYKPDRNTSQSLKHKRDCGFPTTNFRSFSTLSLYLQVS